MEGRVVPFIACTISLASGILILILAGAPQHMLALSLSMFAALVVAATITFAMRWKVSMHAAASAGSVTILTISYGPLAAVTAVAAALVAWSRVAVKDHTIAQVGVGAVVGLTGGAVFWLLMPH